MNFKFCNCKEENDKILKTFESTLIVVMETIEKTNNKFLEMAAKIETEHFKQLEKQSDKQQVVFSNSLDKILELLKPQPVIEKISTLDEGEKNSIEKEEEVVNPFSDFDPTVIRDIKNIQFEGEETIYPIS